MAVDSPFQLDNPPVFVVGPLRSGSTLIRLVLDHHPKLNIFGEFEGAVSQANENTWPELDDYHLFVKNDRQTKALNLMIDESLDYEALVHSFMFQMNQRDSKPIIGACIHSRMDLLPRLWPNAKYIHILRDPRDVARSAIGMGWVGNVYEGTKYWLQPESHWDTLCQQVPKEQRIEIQYEKFIGDPASYCTALCNFLNIEYDPNMLEIDKDTTYAKPDPAYSYQWKRKLSAREVNWVEYQCKENLVGRGYQLSGNPVHKPALPALVYIKIQNRLSRIMFNVKRWGLWLWIQHIFAKRFGTNKWKQTVQSKIDTIAVKHLQ